MNIAVIGWGSLIWCPGLLLIKTRWHGNGPMLPLEFARISSGNRLTLVIYPGVSLQPTYWALSALEGLDDARANLRAREGMKTLEKIHGLDKDGKTCGDIDTDVKACITQWLKEQSHLDAVIWTGLESNWQQKMQRPFYPKDAICFLRGLEDKNRAEEYISNAPEVIRTKVRELIEEELGWKPSRLSGVLFEGQK